MDIGGTILLGRNNIASLNRLEESYSKFNIITDLNSSLFFLALATISIAGFFIFSIYKYRNKIKSENPV